MRNFCHLYDMDDNGFLELDDNGELIRLDEHGDPIIGSPVTQNDGQIDDQNKDGLAPDEENFNIDMQDVEMMDSSSHDDSSALSDHADLGTIEDVDMEEAELEEETEDSSVSSVDPEQDTNGQEAATPGSSRASRVGEPRSKKPCPWGCVDGDGSERHIVRHTLQCKVAGCPERNPSFDSTRELGQHLLKAHNRGNMNGCHWPGCRSAGDRESSNHLLHLRLHNHRLTPPVGNVPSASTSHDTETSQTDHSEQPAANSQSHQHDHDHAQESDANGTSTSNIGDVDIDSAKDESARKGKGKAKITIKIKVKSRETQASASTSTSKEATSSDEQPIITNEDDDEGSTYAPSSSSDDDDDDEVNEDE